MEARLKVETTSTVPLIKIMMIHDNDDTNNEFVIIII